MSSYDDYVELVEKAQLGDKEALDRLVEVVRMRLQEYVFRLTLDQDLTQDIVQESILEMFRVFDRLKRAERFWPWLYGITFNKIRSHYGRQWRHRAVSLSGAGFEAAQANGKDGLADMVSRELKQIVVKSMQELEPRHRAVLTMRCYDQMAYSEIAKIMGCSEFGVRALFYRAKKALAKKLSGYGFGKSSLIVTLAVFGKMTATSEAAAANVSVTAATIKVGVAASLAAMATSKTTIVALTAAGVIAAGSMAVVFSVDKIDSGPQRTKAQGSIGGAGQGAKASTALQECWHFFPEGPGGVVMMRLMESERPGGNSCCRRLQNQHANYRYDKNTITIDNSRMYNSDLSVMRLPTDSPELSRFISQVEGRQGDMEHIAGAGAGLLVICKRDGSGDSRIWRIDRHMNVLEEEYFQFDWPGSAKIIDNRDAMHKRGWTYFTITGQINGEEVTGAGRVPFVYEASRLHYPWVRIEVGGKLTIVDAGTEAGVYDPDGRVVARYAGGSFFEGLARPWTGLHTIDTVRRDAAEQQTWFETKLSAGRDKAEVILTCENVKLVYGIDLESDVVERITFLADNNGDQDAMGDVRFSYLQEIAPASGEFAAPRPRSSARQSRDRLGIIWLARLAEGKLGQEY